MVNKSMKKVKFGMHRFIPYHNFFSLPSLKSQQRSVSIGFSRLFAVYFYDKDFPYPLLHLFENEKKTFAHYPGISDWSQTCPQPSEYNQPAIQVFFVFAGKIDSDRVDFINFL